MIFRNALVSVSEKAGLVDFLRPLVASGLRVVSTGGTLKHLRDHGIDAVDIAQQTGFPEVMDGRVKTLHPRVHMGLLARGGHPIDEQILREQGLQAFDLVIVNLYPFQKKYSEGVRGEELIEFIDVGGPSMLRAAAKNHHRITVISDPKDYSWVGRSGEPPSLEQRRWLAAKVFELTSGYDDAIARALLMDRDVDRSGMQELDLQSRLLGEKFRALRYGENPQQTADWFKDPFAPTGLHDAEILGGKELSYNNLLDLDAACSAVLEFKTSAAVAVKHGNPCGVGISSEISKAAQRAIAADPVSVFGGVIALNRTVDFAAAEALSGLFIECVVAPGFEVDALARLKAKKDLRILAWSGLADYRPVHQFKTIAGGYLMQSADRVGEWSDEWKLYGELPSKEVKSNALLAWKTAAHLKSNAIAIAADGMTVGLGMGQVNRVDAVQHALARMKKHHPNASSAVLASDAFFPFPDSIELCAAAGIKWVIQPGGSIRDQDVLSVAQLHGVNMILTGTRHFRH